jgi:hypothetical protein
MILDAIIEAASLSTKLWTPSNALVVYHCWLVKNENSSLPISNNEVRLAFCKSLSMLGMFAVIVRVILKYKKLPIGHKIKLKYI